MNHASTLPAAATAWSRFSLFTVCLLAVCVSLGTATVSIAKALLLLALVGQLWQDGPSRIRDWCISAPRAVGFILAALAWFALSALWTEAYPGEAASVFMGHARLFWVLAVLYLLNTSERAWTALGWLVTGQLFVMLSSWLMWLGVPIFYATAHAPAAQGILFTSTLEQPIMSTLLAVLLWHCRDRWAARLGRHGHRIVHLALLLTVTNVLFIMTGRTGYLVMLVGLSLSGFMATPARWRLAALAAPVLLAVAAFTLSPRLHDRVMQVQQDITQYRQGNINSSQGLRLDYWRAAVEGIAERPWVGHGVGSYSRVYTEHDGFEKRILRDPHQQYLFWWVEGGLVALALLLSFLISLVTYARQLPMAPRRALVCTAALAATMGLSACPFFGAGMGEHLMLMIAALLATHPQVPTPQIRGV